MAGSNATHAELKQRLEDFEAIIEALREGRIDAVVGKDGVALLRLAEAERRLRESEARYRLLFDRNPDGVFAVDPAGRFLEANPACEAISGYPPGELLQKTFLDLCAPDRVSDTVAEFERGLHERRYAQFETAMIHRDGRRVEVWIAGEPIVSEGRVTSIQCTARDITRRKQVEQALQHLNATLEEQVAARTALAEQRAHDLRRLAAELSHAEHRERKRLAKLLHDDLQQLLIAARLRLPVLAEVDPPERERHLCKMDELLVECLAASRNLTQELSPPVLQMGTVSETIQWLGAWFGERHGLRVTVESENGLPEAPEHLRIFVFHAARELLLNAIKHSGRLEARVRLAGRDGWLSIQVEDRGANFDPRAVEALVERPEGFGLFNIRERLEALGGRLEIDATPRGGARFRLLIPLAEDALPDLLGDESPHAELAARERTTRGKEDPIRLLLAEDHAVVREGLVGLLDCQPDFQVIGEAADGEHAVRQAESLNPDAIVMDINMPTMDGIEATRRIRRTHPHVVIIGLSFHDEEAVVRAMLEAGADTYVSKHAPAKEFVAAVRAACLPCRPAAR